MHFDSAAQKFVFIGHKLHTNVEQIVIVKSVSQTRTHTIVLVTNNVAKKSSNEVKTKYTNITCKPFRQRAS